MDAIVSRSAMRESNVRISEDRAAGLRKYIDRHAGPTDYVLAPFAAKGGVHMQEFERIKVLFVAGFGPIVRDKSAGRNLYGVTLNIPFKEEKNGYLHTEALKGVQSFALWPLEQAALSCFGKDSWPDNTPVPQAWLEFDVADIAGATVELESRGYRMLVKNKKEPWGQSVTRFLSPEGLLVGLTITPSMRHS
ncbi:VOC family protein [Paraburkholderia sediminicola]